MANKPQVRRNFDKDGRSRKVIFVAHCMLNQNARDAGTADFPAMMKPLLRAMEMRDIGIVQLPCPELMVLGLGRGRGPFETIRGALERPESQLRLGGLADQVVDQIKEYQRHGFHVVGILGKNGSPTCGVHEGVFVRLLRQRLRAEGLQVEVQGIDDHSQQKAIEWVSKHAPQGAHPSPSDV
jgi:predicted secreted protein